MDATFVMTFVAPLYPTSDDPLYDLDMASYSLVKSFGSRLGPLGVAHPEAPWPRDRRGTVYPDMPWEPKLSFRAVALLRSASGRRLISFWPDIAATPTLPPTGQIGLLWRLCGAAFRRRRPAPIGGYGLSAFHQYEHTA